MLTGNDRQKAIRATEDQIGRMLRDWEQGRNTSPAPLDYVIVAREELQKRDPDSFYGTTDEGEEALADAVDELMIDQQLTSRRAIARYIIDELNQPIDG